MASISRTRRNPELAKRIQNLKLELAPIRAYPNASIAPIFPRTMMEFYLLSEDQLDSMAHFYGQSTPDQYTMYYERQMRWDKDYLLKPSYEPEEDWESWVRSPPAEAATEFASKKRRRDDTDNEPPTSPLPPKSPRLTKWQRIAIKRRKFGNFIGLRGCETPIEEARMRLNYLEHRLITNVEASKRYCEKRI